MKITKFLIAIFLLAPMMQSCMDDVTELDDPRDAICKKYRVTDSEGYSWDSEIIKSSADKQTVYIWNLHGLDGDGTVGQIPTSEMFTAKFAAGTNQSVLTMDNKTLTKNGEDKTIVSGTATILASNINEFTLSYSLKEGADPAVDYTASFGPHSTTPVKKKRPIKVVE